MGRKSPEVTIKGETKTIAQWCNHFGIFAQAVYRKIALGYTPQEAILSSRSKKVGMPKCEQTPSCKAPTCPKCASSQTIWNGGSVYKEKRTSFIRCHNCGKASSVNPYNLHSTF